MKKIVLILTAVLFTLVAGAQTPGKTTLPPISRAGDHIMFQVGTEVWSGLPDSIDSHLKGLARVANVYIMLDKPFKGNPKMSVAFGVGVGTSSIYFSKMDVDIRSTTAKLPFVNQDSLNHFKKYKLATAFLEVPVELRYTANPYNERKSWKFALGGKIGTLLSIHTKGKTLQDKNGTSINTYTAKETTKRFFNTTRLSLTGRVGLGNFSLFGAYQVNSLLKDGVGPDIKPFQVGLTISGL
ncbi:MAG: outer membrane beta-barrel protein [Ferruginibacter sp.]